MPMKVRGKTPAGVNIRTRTIKKNPILLQENLSTSPRGKWDNPVTSAEECLVMTMDTHLNVAQTEQ